MKSIVILAINPDPETSGFLSLLEGGGLTVVRKDSLDACSEQLEGDVPTIILTPPDALSYNDLTMKSVHRTAVILIGRDGSGLLKKASEWPGNEYIDPVLMNQGDDSWHVMLRLALDRAAAYARINAEADDLGRSRDQQEEKLREVLKEIAEVRLLIKTNYIREVEKRLAVESRYLFFQKEQQRIEIILRKIYEANDVVSLLDVVPDIRDMVGAQSATVYVVDESENLGRFLKPILWDNAYLSHSDFTGFVTSTNSPDFAASAVRYRHPIHITEIPPGAKTPHRYKSLLKNPLQNLVAVPIMHDQDVIGVIELYNKTGPEGIAVAGFSREDQQILSNMSEHIALAMIKLNLIHHDALTGLLRPDPFFHSVIQKMNAMHKRVGDVTASAVVMGDVDWFKNYNDRNGQEAGNLLLRELARVLRSSIREDDLLCRYGGEEFLFFLTGVKDIEEACLLTERIRKNVEDHYFQFQEFQPGRNLTMSFGVTIFPKSPDERAMAVNRSHLKRLVGEADLALAEAKGKRRPELAGRKADGEPDKNKVRSFDPDARNLKNSARGEIDMPRAYREMRKSERMNVSTVLMFKEAKEGGGFKVSKTANLSSGGVKVITDARLPIASTLETMLVLDENAPTLRSDVVYSEKAESGVDCYYSGLRFRDLTMQNIAVLENFLQNFRRKDTPKN